MYDPAERVDPLPGTGDDPETDSDSEDSGCKCEYVCDTADNNTLQAYTVPGATDACTYDFKDGGE